MQVMLVIFCREFPGHLQNRVSGLNRVTESVSKLTYAHFYRAYAREIKQIFKLKLNNYLFL